MGKVTNTSVDQRAKTADPEGTLRAELLGRLIAAQASLEAVLEDLRRAGGDADPVVAQRCADQLATVQSMRDGIASATPAALIAMKAGVGACVTSSQTVVQNTRAATATADAALLAATGAAARNEVESLSADLFDRRIFDRYLQFKSREDEEQYRKREEETRRYVAQQLAAKTPEGDLNAGGAVMGQMLDAHAHGAGDSPEFAARWERLVETTRRHREAMRGEGRSTEEFDRNLKASVRRYLRDKGLTDAEIDDKLAVAADPLDAVKPYLTTERDALTFEKSTRTDRRLSPAAKEDSVVAVAVTSSGDTAQPLALQSEPAPGLDAVMAKLRSAGIAPAPAQPEGSGFAHGVEQIAGAEASRGPSGRL